MENLKQNTKKKNIELNISNRSLDEIIAIVFQQGRNFETCWKNESNLEVHRKNVIKFAKRMLIKSRHVSDNTK